MSDTNQPATNAIAIQPIKGADSFPPQQNSKSLAIVALIVAGLSLAVNATNFLVNYFRDREKLKTKTAFWPRRFDPDAERVMPAIFRIEAVNSGRRLIILTGLRVLYEDGLVRVMFLGKGQDDGRTLLEKQSMSLDAADLEQMLINPDIGAAAVDMWFVDTLGKQHPIKDAKQCLAAYFSNDGKTDAQIRAGVEWAFGKPPTEPKDSV